jgi:hypothetical protein
MIEKSKVIIFAVAHTIIIGLLILGARIYYSMKNQDYVVNPTWIEEHKKQCSSLPFPSFFDKEILTIYNFLYLDLGVFLGLVIDSLLLNGTRVDYNHPRVEDNKVPFIGVIIRFAITIGWVLLNLWVGTYYLSMLVHHQLYLLAIPYFICGLGLTTFLKYIFQLFKATRTEIYPIAGTNAVELRRADQS